MNIGKTMQMGTKLVRTFGEGVTKKHVITETVGNKTTTQVLDAYGKVLRDRVKTITREDVGDKVVISKKAEIEDIGHLYPVQESLDKVYNKAGKLLGFRYTHKSCGSTYKYLYKVGGDRFANGYKTLSSDGLRTIHRPIDIYDASISEITNPYCYGPAISFNKKGLPIPPELLKADARGCKPSSENFSKMSFKEMLQLCKETPFSEKSGFSKVDIGGFNIIDYVKNMIK